MARPFFVVCAIACVVGCGAAPRSGAATPSKDGAKSENPPAPHAVDARYFPADGVPSEDQSLAAFGGNGVVTLVALSDGAVRWTAKDAAYVGPLVVAGDHVYAAEPNDHAIDVATLDVASGAAIAHSKPIPLPSWAPTQPTGGGAMTATARIDEAGALVLHWIAMTRYWGGVAPTPEVLKASSHDAEGAARIDLSSGAVTILSDDEAKAEGERQKRSATKISPLPQGVPSEAEYSGPVIVGDRLYWTMTEPMTTASTSMTVGTELHAFDLVNHVELWKRVVRRDRFFPPPP